MKNHNFCPRVAPQLSDFYKSIMAVGDMKPKFDEEVFTISGRKGSDDNRA